MVIIINIIIIMKVFSASCPSAIWQVSLFMNQIWSLSLCFLWWRCIFYSIFFLFLVLFDKKSKKKSLWAQWPFLFTFWVLLLFFLSPAASICVTTLCLFPDLHNNNNNKKMKINQSPDFCFFCFLYYRKKIQLIKCTFFK